MKTHIHLRGRSRGLFIGIALILAAFAMRSEAQQYAISWYKVAGGGGASSNTPFVVHGTIGQHDASEKLTGGAYTLTGGFWAMVAVQSPGAPLLTIQLSNPTTALGDVACAGAWVQASEKCRSEHDKLDGRADEYADGIEWTESDHCLTDTGQPILSPHKTVSDAQHRLRNQLSWSGGEADYLVFFASLAPSPTE